jgi:hypothetical protein
MKMNPMIEKKEWKPHGYVIIFVFSSLLNVDAKTFSDRSQVFSATSLRRCQQYKKTAHILKVSKRPLTTFRELMASLRPSRLSESVVGIGQTRHAFVMVSFEAEQTV